MPIIIEAQNTGQHAINDSLKTARSGGQGRGEGSGQPVARSKGLERAEK